MVLRLAGFAAINEDRRIEYERAEQQTLEAQEARVIDEYERALREIQNNNLQTAEVRKARKELNYFKRIFQIFMIKKYLITFRLLSMES